MAVVPVVSFELEGNAAYRSGGRLFLMSESRYDQRRKTDEHQRIWKHICICDHIAHPLCREVDNLAVLTDAPLVNFRPSGRLFYACSCQPAGYAVGEYTFASIKLI